MSVVLTFPYATFAAGATVTLDRATEASLVQQRRAAYTSNPGDVFAPLSAVEQQSLRDLSPNIPKIAIRRAGNLTTGIGADFNGASVLGKLNLGGDVLIPANTMVAGTSIIRVRFGVYRTSTDAAFIDIRIGSTNGTADNTITLSAQFSTSANNALQIDAQIAVTSTKYLCNYTRYAQNVGFNAELAESASAPVLTQDNYLNLCVSGAAGGLYRVTDLSVDVFR